MKNLKSILAILFILLLFISCVEDEGFPVIENSVSTLEKNIIQNKDTILTFGRYYKRCEGNGCVEMFRIERSQLLEDVVDNYPPSVKGFYKGQFVSFFGSNKVDTRGLITNFPLELFRERNTIIGTPATRDERGIYIEYQDGSNHEFWLVNMHGDNIPIYLRKYIAAINETINDIGKINNKN